MQIGLPDAFQEVLTVFLGEVAQVGDEGRNQQDISTQGALLLFEVLHGFSPSHILRGESPNLQFSKQMDHYSGSLSNTAGSGHSHTLFLTSTVICGSLKPGDGISKGYFAKPPVPLGERLVLEPNLSWMLHNSSEIIKG